MDPNDYARKEIKKMMPQFVVAPPVCPEPQGTYTVFSWGASKGDGMEYGHYTWKALPEGTEFYGIEHVDTGAVFFVDAKRVRDTYDLFYSMSQAARIAEDTAHWHHDQERQREYDW
jgi:hypothetical protein